MALYDSSNDVVQLTSSNFDRLVTQSDDVWIVEFYAPWCNFFEYEQLKNCTNPKSFLVFIGPHSKKLAPQYEKMATALKNVVKVGAVDCVEYKDFLSKFGVQGFPTIRIFSGNNSTLYNGEQTAKGIAEAGLAQVEATRK